MLILDNSNVLFSFKYYRESVVVESGTYIWMTFYDFFKY